MSKSVSLIVTVALAGAIGFVAASLSRGPSRAQPASPPASPAPSPGSAADLVDSSPADLKLSPAGVVEAQMEALEHCRQNAAAIGRVYAFASPGNKSVTGPLSNFEEMVWRPPYNNLIVNRGWTVGKPVVRDNLAAVLVTAVDRGGGLWAFRFYLSRQLDAPSERWMTDAVFAVGSPAMGAPSDQPPASHQGRKS